MTKLECDRIVLWLTLAASALTIYAFEIDINARKKNDRRENNNQSVLAEFDSRLNTIEKKIDELLSSVTHSTSSNKTI